MQKTLNSKAPATDPVEVLPENSNIPPIPQTAVVSGEKG